MQYRIMNYYMESRRAKELHSHTEPTRTAVPGRPEYDDSPLERHPGGDHGNLSVGQAEQEQDARPRRGRRRQVGLLREAAQEGRKEGRSGDIGRKEKNDGRQGHEVDRPPREGARQSGKDADQSPETDRRGLKLALHGLSCENRGIHIDTEPGLRGLSPAPRAPRP